MVCNAQDVLESRGLIEEIVRGRREIGALMDGCCWPRVGQSGI